MRLFGLTISRQKALTGTSGLSSVPSRGGWFRILEPFTGAWQRNIEQTPESVLSFHAVYACVTLIATDIAKLPIRLVQKDEDGIWQEIESPAFSPVLRTPNHYQTRIQFITSWMLSKLIHGNAYVLKQRDERNVVTSLYVLDPSRVQTLVAPNGAVYYSLGADDLSNVGSDRPVVPASEIIHDLMPPLYHPLCGVSPITACWLPAVQGLRAQQNAVNLSSNGSRPGGVLTSPTVLSEEQQKQIQEAWERNFTGANQGRVAVLGADLKYQEMGFSAVDVELIDQLKLSAENVCSAYHVPPYMVGVGTAPSYNNIEALGVQYYAQCLQIHIESIESLLDHGLGLVTGEARPYGTEFDLDGLLRMDTATMMTALDKAKNYFTPNEGRKRLNLPPTAGGDAVYRQQQDFSLEALAKRDQKDDPFAKGVADSSAPPAPHEEPDADDLARRFEAQMTKAYAA